MPRMNSPIQSQSVPEEEQARQPGAIMKIAPALLMGFALLMLAYYLGSSHRDSLTVVLAAILGFLGLGIVVGIAYEQGKLTVMTEASELLRDASEALDEMQEIHTLKLTGGGPMDGMSVPHPLSTLQGRANLVVRSEDNDVEGVYMQSPDDPTILIWMPTGEDYDAA